MKTRPSRPSAVVAVSVAALLTACSPEPQLRRFEEVVIAPTPQSGMDTSAAHAHDHSTGVASEPLTWTAPAGWVEGPGSGMRLTSFAVAGGVHTGDCSVVVLGGGAGGLGPNVERWLGQLGLDVPPREEFETFLSNRPTFQTAGGQEGLFIDLTELSTPEAKSSMLAAVVRRADKTVFVKLAGHGQLLTAERERFLELCRSLR